MPERKSQAFPIVVSGPSGVGKTTLVARVLAADKLLCESVSVTTRNPRDGEASGSDYYFVERDAFEKMKDGGELVEWAEVHGELYGTPRTFVERELAAGRDVVLNIDIQGGDSVKKAFPNAVMVFILPPSFEILEERLRQRGSNAQDDLDTRIANARKEITASERYSYVVINDDLTAAVDAVCAIIRGEREKP